MKRNRRPSALAALMPLVYLLLVVALVMVISINGVYPSGEQTMFHLYRGNAVLRALGQGTALPSYDPMWFNGYESLRFTPPLAGCFLALCQAMGGSVFFGYLLFIGLVFYLGAMSWLLIGLKSGRGGLGAVFGLVWNLMPYQVYMTFVVGDLTWALGLQLLPWIFYHGQRCIYGGSRSSVWWVGILECLLALTHVGLAGMMLLCFLAAAFVYGPLTHGGKRAGNFLLAGCGGFLLSGVWLVPYLLGVSLPFDTSEYMAQTFQELFQTLNPLGYFQSEGREVYFGVAMFLVLCLAALFSGKESAGPAWTGVILVLMTTSTARLVAQALPLNQMFKMFWVLPVAAVMGFFALLSWRAIRPTVLVLLCLLLAADSALSLPGITGSGWSSIPAEERMASNMTTALLDRAQEITTQRLAILDEGNLGSDGVFLASAWKNPVPISGGDQRAHAATKPRLERLSRALTGGNCLYVFDRCLELGCDTVLIQGGVLPQRIRDSGAMEAAAEKLGYSLVENNGAFELYHIDLGAPWGLVSQYSAIGIGTTAYYTALDFPNMEETQDANLNHYTFGQLSQYDLVFLSGFTYDERDAAEELVLSLSEAGVRVVIAADGIPAGQSAPDRRFLGVLSNSIEFSGGYPELETKDGKLETDLFPREFTDWHTVYVEGLDDVWGNVLDNDMELPFIGTVKNENIVVYGLNLSYYEVLTKNTDVKELLSRVFTLPGEELPSRRVVPLELTYRTHGFDVTAPEAEVNTTLAWHESFASDRPLVNRNGLVQVGEGVTSISLTYPHLWQGVAVTLAGLLLLALDCLGYRKLQPAGEPPAEAKPETPEEEEGTT